MKKVFISVLLLTVALFSYSQMRMAIMGGGHSASVKETNSLPAWETSIKPGYTGKAGMHLGILVEVPLSSRFFFQPGIQYMAKGQKYFMSNDPASAQLTDTVSATSNQAINYIEIPLNIAYKVPLGKNVKFLISAGPYVSFFYSGKQKFETRLYTSNSFKNVEQPLATGKDIGKINTVDLGMNARAGFEIGNIILTGFMSRGLSNFYHASYKGTFNHKVVGASLGIWLNKTKEPVVVRPVSIPVKEIPEETVVDTDGDGITDEADACPDLAGTPEFNGCPVPDSDGDGVNDQKDQCPSEPGTAATKGCPVHKADTVVAELKPVEKTPETILQFAASSDQLLPDSAGVLQYTVKVLQSDPSVKVMIEGHADESGPARMNQTLALKRAEQIKKYLVQNGISDSKITVRGYGSRNPVTTNTTFEGRALNRRVEIKLIR